MAKGRYERICSSVSADRDWIGERGIFGWVSLVEDIDSEVFEI